MWTIGTLQAATSARNTGKFSAQIIDKVGTNQLQLLSDSEGNTLANHPREKRRFNSISEKYRNESKTELELPENKSSRK